ncbi:hypothetical protein ACFQE1_17825, partial [Halobium palmae]
TPRDDDSSTTAGPDAPTDVGRFPKESDCPPLGADRVVCFDEVDPDLQPIILSPSATSGTLPRAQFAFTLRNDAEVAFESNFYHWRLLKRVGGEWFRVAPTYWPEPLHTLKPDGRHTWSVAVDNGPLAESRDLHAEGTEDLTLVGLGGGEYAFGVTGSFRGDDRRIALLSQFSLAGDPLDLTPTTLVTGTERDGDRVTVDTKPNPNGASGPAAFVVERVEDPKEDVPRAIPEQLVRDSRFRDTLPFFEEGVRTVRLRRPRGGRGSVGSWGSGDGATFEYRGTVYRTREVESTNATTGTTA